MREEHLSDLSAIAMHYGERRTVDETCLAFIQGHPRNFFKIHYLITDLLFYFYNDCNLLIWNVWVMVHGLTNVV